MRPVVEAKRLDCKSQQGSGERAPVQLWSNDHGWLGRGKSSVASMARAAVWRQLRAEKGIRCSASRSEYPLWQLSPYGNGWGGRERQMLCIPLHGRLSSGRSAGRPACSCRHMSMAGSERARYSASRCVSTRSARRPSISPNRSPASWKGSRCRPCGLPTSASSPTPSCAMPADGHAQMALPVDGQIAQDTSLGDNIGYTLDTETVNTSSHVSTLAPNALRYTPLRQ
jgi:hypothetical protein